ncbi:MAG TPA: hypothetical protein VFW83_00425 [Bryobacteraceae bacterium]|nr:hypothetical protein [Bryobacteraceae bacterium]
MKKNSLIPVWFFVGLLIGIYGLLICASGLAEWSHPANTVLAGLHAPVWWGGVLAIAGAAYAIAFRPGK